MEAMEKRLNKKFAAYKKEIGAHKTKIAVHEEQFAAGKKEIDALKEKITVHEKWLAAGRKEIEVLKKEVGVHEKKIEDIESIFNIRELARIVESLLLQVINRVLVVRRSCRTFTHV